MASRTLHLAGQAQTEPDSRLGVEPTAIATIYRVYQIHGGTGSMIQLRVTEEGIDDPEADILIHYVRRLDRPPYNPTIWLVEWRNTFWFAYVVN